MTAFILPDNPRSIFDALTRNIPMLMVCFVAIFIVIAVSAFHVRAQRRQAMQQWALESGCQYLLAPAGGVLAELQRLHPTMSGITGSVRFVNVLQGEVGGLPCLIADRWVRAGKSSSCTTILVLFFPAPFPGFTVCRENIFLKLADKLGYHNVDFPGSPGFSQRYFVHGNPEEAVRALFTPEVLQAFEQLDPGFPYTVHADGATLMFYRRGRQLPVPELRALRDKAEMLAGAFTRARAGAAFH